MSEPVIEVVYSLSEDDLIQNVRVKLKSRFRDPMFRVKVAFILNFTLCVVGVLMLAYLLLGRRPLDHDLLSSGLFISVVGGLAGYRSLMRYRNFYEIIRKKAKTTDWLVFKANASGFTITRPGISESSINWTAVKSVNMQADYLFIFTKEDTMFRIPARFLQPGQWDALRAMLRASWD